MCLDPALNQQAPEPLIVRRTRRLISKHENHAEPYEVTFRGLRLRILPNVFCPTYGEGSQLLADTMDARPSDVVWDVGTGSGVLAIMAARRGARVVATDVSSDAVECARYNVRRHHYESKVEIRKGNLFAPLRPEERFDLILFNPPFMNGTPMSPLERAIYDPGYATLKAFFSGVKPRLTVKGRVLFAFSNVGDLDGFYDLALTNHLTCKVIASKGTHLRFLVFRCNAEPK